MIVPKAARWTAALIILPGILASCVSSSSSPRLGARTQVCALSQRPDFGFAATNTVMNRRMCGGTVGDRNNAVELTYIGNAPPGYRIEICAFDTTQQGAFVTANPEWRVVGTISSPNRCHVSASVTNNIAIIERQ